MKVLDMARLHGRFLRHSLGLFRELSTVGRRRMRDPLRGHAWNYA